MRGVLIWFQIDPDDEEGMDKDELLQSCVETLCDADEGDVTVLSLDVLPKGTVML